MAQHWRRILSTIAIYSIFVAIPPAHAEAPDTISLTYSAGLNRFEGEISATDAKCAGPDRVVKLWKVREGEDRKIGGTTTDADGNFAVGKKDARGRYAVDARQRAKNVFGEFTELASCARLRAVIVVRE